MLSQVDPGQRRKGSQLGSPVEKNEKDAEQRRHGRRDETRGSSALHRVFLERSGEMHTGSVKIQHKSLVSVRTCVCA